MADIAAVAETAAEAEAEAGAGDSSTVVVVAVVVDVAGAAAELRRLVAGWVHSELDKKQELEDEQ